METATPLHRSGGEFTWVGIEVARTWVTGECDKAVDSVQWIEKMEPDAC